MSPRPGWTSAVALVGLALMVCMPPGIARANQPWTRNAIVARVLEENPELASIQQAAVASKQVPAQARALPDPVVSWSSAPGSVAAGSRFGQRLELRQQLPAFGSLQSSAQAAESRAEADETDVDTARQRLALEAVRLYDELALVETSVRVLEEHRVLLVSLQASALAGYESGRARAQDPIQADVELAHVEHHLVVLRSHRRWLAAALNALMHRAPSEPIAVAELAALPPLEDAFRERPEVRAAVQREQAAADQLLATRHATRPRVSLAASYNSMWSTPAHQWMVGFGSEIPVQRAGRKAHIAEATAVATQARLARQAAEDEAGSELEQARVHFAESKHVLKLFAERLVPAASLRVDTARASFEAGQEQFDTLIDAERSLRDVELDQARALAQAWTRRAELQLALGQPMGASEVSP